MLKASNVAHLPDRDVRAEQIEEARRMAAQEREGFVPSRRVLHVNRNKSPVKKQPKGHEAFLKALETSGAEIQIEKCDGSIVTGTVIHSDKYTISIRTFVPNPANPEGDKLRRDRVIFKHDISEFTAITPRPEVEDSKTEEGHAV